MMHSVRHFCFDLFASTLVLGTSEQFINKFREIIWGNFDNWAFFLEWSFLILSWDEIANLWGQAIVMIVQMGYLFQVKC